MKTQHEIQRVSLGAAWEKEHVWLGRFSCSRYIGEFTVPSLQSKAELGLWYARATGTGLGIEGEGATPELAVEDCRMRARAQVEELKSVYSV